MKRPAIIFLLASTSIVILLFLLRCQPKEKEALSYSETKLEEGLKLYNAKQFKLAAKALRDIEKESSSYETAHSLLLKVDSLILVEDSINSEINFEKGVKLYNEGKFQSAIYALDEVKKENKNYDKAQSLLVKADKRVRKEAEIAAAKQLKGAKIQSKIQSNSNGSKFVLTHLLGKKLPKAASFYVDGSRWKLDYNNGDKIYYTVVSGNEANPLCGINTVDSNGDACEICITKNGSSSIIEFKYAQGTLSFNGYFDK